MIKAANGKAEGGKEVENDLTRFSLWSVLIFRALPLKRSTLYNAAPLLPAHFLAPLPHPPSPISTTIKGPSSYIREEIERASMRSITATIMLRESYRKRVTRRKCFCQSRYQSAHNDKRIKFTRVRLQNYIYKNRSEYVERQ